MTISIAASHAKGKFASDKIFGAAAVANKAAAQYGKENVVNATIGAILDDQEKLVCLPTVEKVFRSLAMPEIFNYAPIAGLPEYLKAAIDLVFADDKPEAYIKAVSTAGGSGVLHHCVWNYAETGDAVLTHDWHWSPYGVLCQDALREIAIFSYFDVFSNFNTKAFEVKVKELLDRQDSLLIILNTPAHNPTGYSLSDGEWDQVIDVCKQAAADGAKKITLLVDIAYLDYAGEKNASRSFMKKFGKLPANILVVLAFSMSKGYTMYGQRTGAMLGISSNKEVIKEFEDINQFTSRATWSNINRGAMKLLSVIYRDKILSAELEKERNFFYNMIRERADIFMREAAEAKLEMLPYRAGFFLSVPAADSDAVCNRLHSDNIFAVPLAKGVRIAVCAVPAAKITGMAGKVAKALSD